MSNDNKILFVDDEPRVLLGLHRTLSLDFHVDIAVGAQVALRALAERGPFAVVVSDFKMPMIDGVEFMEQVKVMFPDTVRIMLTGQADINATMEAVNRGNVFRFLTKPCPTPALAQTLIDALEQHRLITSEQNLLHETLTGSLELLMEILSVTCPELFSRSLNIGKHVKSLAEVLNLRDMWQLEAAAVLSQIGRIAAYVNAKAEQFGPARASAKLARNHAEIGAALLRRIQRLETAATIVSLQDRPFRDYPSGASSPAAPLIDLAGQVLHAAVDFEEMLGCGSTAADAVKIMRANEGEYNPEVLSAMERINQSEMSWLSGTAAFVSPDAIARPLDVILSSRSQQLSYPLLDRLRIFAGETCLDGPVSVPEACDAGLEIQ